AQIGTRLAARRETVRAILGAAARPAHFAGCARDAASATVRGVRRQIDAGTAALREPGRARDAAGSARAARLAKLRRRAAVAAAAAVVRIARDVDARVTAALGAVVADEVAGALLAERGRATRSGASRVAAAAMIRIDRHEHALVAALRAGTGLRHVTRPQAAIARHVAQEAFTARVVGSAGLARAFFVDVRRATERHEGGAQRQR